MVVENPAPDVSTTTKCPKGHAHVWTAQIDITQAATVIKLTIEQCEVECRWCPGNKAQKNTTALRKHVWERHLMKFGNKQWAKDRVAVGKAGAQSIARHNELARNVLVDDEDDEDAPAEAAATNETNKDAAESDLSDINESQTAILAAELNDIAQAQARRGAVSAQGGQGPSKIQKKVARKEKQTEAQRLAASADVFLKW